MNIGRLARAALAGLVLVACDPTGVAPPAEPAVTPTADAGAPIEPSTTPPVAEPTPVAEPMPVAEPAPPIADPHSSATALVTRPTAREGATVGAWVVRPPTPPTHAVVLMVGGSGRLGLTAKGVGAGARDNFLVRIHAELVAASFVVAIVDAPSDRPQGLEGTRASSEHAEDLAVILAWLRAEHPVPTWIVGTSRGSISAANAAARLGARGPDGVVLLSPITAGKNEKLSDVRLAAVTVPTLVVSHRADRCKGSPPVGARGLARKLGRKAIRRELSVGDRKAAREADPCDSQTHHGFVGVEDEVTAAIVGFVRAPSATK